MELLRKLIRARNEEGKKMTDLKKVPTEELVQELIGRDGIQTYSGGLYRRYAITTQYGQAMPVLPPYYRVIVIREENHSSE